MKPRRSLSALLVQFLAAVISFTPIVAQTGTITGRVVDARTLQPIATAQVYITNTNASVLSQANGQFRLTNVPAGARAVTATQIGFTARTVEVTVAAGQVVTLDFSLEPQALALNALVVTGTPGGTQRRAVGNAVERVRAAEITTLAPIRSVEQLLQTGLPGVTISGVSGMAGLDASPIRIRGGSSLGVTNSPIVYVDGIRMNSGIRSMGRSSGSSRLNDVNPEDIESIEVIKGPAAATLYGTEASNGVIQIITKKGVSGSPAFDVVMETGTNWFPNAREVIPMGYSIDPVSKQIVSSHLLDTELARTGHPLFQRGQILNIGISARGGTDLLRYFGSINRGDQEGIVSWNTDERTSGRLALTLIPNPKLNISINGAFNSAATRSGGENLWGTIVRQNPTTLNDPKRRGFEVVIDAYRDGQDDRISVDRSTWSMETTYNPMEWLNTRFVVGSDLTNEERTLLTYREADAPAGIFGSNGLGAKTVNNWETRLNSVDLAGTAKFRLGNVGSATSAGIQYNGKEVVTETLIGNEFATAALTTISAAARTQGSESFLENTTLGVYVQQQLDLRDRLFLTGAVRLDDNSAFGEQFDAAVYPKLSATWVVSEEPFWTIPYLETFRVRGAWGQAGQQPDIFAATRLYQTLPSVSGVPVLEPTSIGNADLGPEKGQELELGFDAALFGDRLDFEFTQYWKQTKNAIVPVPLAPSSGFPGNRLQNIGLVRNWGSELAVNMGVVRGNRFSWDVQLAGATTFNRVDDIGGVERLVTGNVPEAQGYHVAGYPLATIWGLRVISAEFVSGTSGAIKEATAMCDGGQGPRTTTLGGRWGGDPVPCSTAPLVWFGRSGEPTWTANLNSTFTIFGNLRLLTTIDARGGHANMNQVTMARMTAWANALEGLEQDDPIIMAQRQFDRRWLGIYKAGFARLREVALNYSLPDRYARLIGASRASINLAARNLNYLWMEEEYHNLSGEHIISPEIREVGNEFSGHSHVQLPPLSQALIEFRTSF